VSALSLFRIVSVRNILVAELELHPKLNLIHGENGSGKTSILEAAHLLSSGRSFRTSKSATLINHNADELSIYAEDSAARRIGLAKPRRQSPQLKLDMESQQNWDAVARLLPVQVLDASSFLLLEGGPKSRRRFLDWGVFHVEHSFLNYWRVTRKCIANRNQLLKAQRLDEKQLKAWDMELCQAAAAVDLARKRYFRNFLPAFNEIYKSLAEENAIEELSLEYNRGWDSEIELVEVLQFARPQDLKYGATQNGPHRADIVVKVGQSPAIDVLSRGQQKVLVSALKIAQGSLYAEAIQDRCIYLVDDLPAELDQENRAKILENLLALDSQLFVTCVELNSVKSCLQSSPEMSTFHVERGTITA
tara:strand:- start:1062 stop:2147 length:1086 start_codon:yes stop_codon:yes gene_type:complete